MSNSTIVYSTLISEKIKTEFNRYMTAIRTLKDETLIRKAFLSFADACEKESKKPFIRLSNTGKQLTMNTDNKMELANNWWSTMRWQDRAVLKDIYGASLLATDEEILSIWEHEVKQKTNYDIRWIAQKWWFEMTPMDRQNITNRYVTTYTRWDNLTHDQIIRIWGKETLSDTLNKAMIENEKLKQRNADIKKYTPDQQEYVSELRDKAQMFFEAAIELHDHLIEDDYHHLDASVIVDENYPFTEKFSAVVQKVRSWNASIKRATIYKKK